MCAGVKKLVVGFLRCTHVRLILWRSITEVILWIAYPILYCEKIRVFQAWLMPEYISME